MKSLEKRGHMMREVTRDGTYVWSKAVRTLLAEQMKFALNAAVDMLPHNANLHLWKKKPNDSCPLCGERQTLVHTLNNCKVALDQRRYNKCHDEVLQAIASTVTEKLPSTTSFTTDLGDTYQYPLHITPTTLRPDILWWDDGQKQLVIIELTVSRHHLRQQQKGKKPSTMTLLPVQREQGITPPLSHLKWAHAESHTHQALFN